MLTKTCLDRGTMAFALKRRSERKRYRDGARVTGDFGLCYGTIENLSCLGLGLRLDRSLAIGERVETQFSVYIPGQGRVSFRLRAQVVRCVSDQESFDVGLKFVEIAGHEQKFLGSLVNQTSSLGAERY